MTGPYDDIINLPRPVSKTRPRMPLMNRAAQFAPFAALAGYDTAIQGTARVTEDKIELDQSAKDAISKRLQLVAERLKENPVISITFFQPDQMKAGGCYLTRIGQVKKVYEYERIIVMTDGTRIPMDEIISIEGRIFDV